MKSKINIFIVLLCFGFVFGQNQASPVPPPIAQTIDVDTTYDDYLKGQLKVDSLLNQNKNEDQLVHPKKFEDQFYNKYKTNEFNYETVKPREALMDKITRKIREILESIFGNLDPNKATSYTEIILRLIAILVIGFVIYFLAKFLLSKDGSFFFGKKNRKVNIRSEELSENIHEINFPESIAMYEQKGNYRYAIRYQFLYILKKLSDKKQISWNPEKTNKDYVGELSDLGFNKDFSRLSYIFDYVWYGEFDIDENRYKKFKEEFLAFKN